MHYGWTETWGIWQLGWMIGVWLVGIVLAIGVAVLLVRAFRSESPDVRGPGTKPPPDAHEILRQRYARGEIDDAEYRRRTEMLQQRSGASPRAHEEAGPAG